MVHDIHIYIYIYLQITDISIYASTNAHIDLYLLIEILKSASFSIYHVACSAGPPAVSVVRHDDRYVDVSGVMLSHRDTPKKMLRKEKSMVATCQCAGAWAALPG